MMNLFELYLKITGYDISSASRKLKHIQSLPSDKFIEWQNNQKWIIAKYHYDNNPLYKRKIGNVFPDKWEDLPIMKKSDLAISSGGTFLWECIYLGIPSLVVNYSKKNFKNSDYLRKINCLKVIGSKNISEIQLKKNLNRSMSNLNFLNSWQISKIIDGYGVQRIKQKVLNF